MFWLAWQLVGVIIAVAIVVGTILLLRGALKAGASLTGFVLDRLHWILGGLLLLVLLWLLSWWK